jgi:hypothetical protein
MLELPRLLIQPWASPRDTAVGGARPYVARLRGICDPDTGRAVGFACAPAAGGGWWRWLMRPVLEVHESEDASLLFTISRAWALAPRWEVRDAEGRRLGVFDPYNVAPATGTTPARGPGTAGPHAPAPPDVLVLEPVPGSFGREVELPPLPQLVAVSRTADGTLVVFAPGAVENPFARMLVLAAVLTADERKAS